MPDRKPIIAVIGSGSDAHSRFSEPLGRWLAQQGCDLINGGGGGVMASVSRAFAEVKDREGKVIGILPSSGPCDSPGNRVAYTPPAGYPNDWIDLPVYTHLHRSGASGKELASRNHIIVLTADVIVALPGGEGTRSEIQLAMEYGKPLLILNANQVWEEFRNSGAVTVETMEDLLSHLETLLAPRG